MLTIKLKLQCSEDKLATAILDRKAAPNKLMVDDATNDDNSVCTMATATMEKLELFRYGFRFKHRFYKLMPVAATRFW